MEFIENIKEKVKNKNCTILLPESSDVRVLKAASIIKKENFCNIILIGNKEEINLNAKINNINIDDIQIIDQATYENTNIIINEYYELRKHKGITLVDSHNTIMNNNFYFGNMLVKMGVADGLVGGAITSSSDVLRPALQIIKTNPGVKLASGFFIMDTNSKYGNEGTFIYSDCGMIQNPTSEELAEIAYNSNNSYLDIIGNNPTIALLSHSTYASSKHPDVDKVTNALKIVREKYPNLLIDGELQFDAAVIPEVAKLKCPESKVAGNANILIFPDLDAGNIAYKITERLGGAKAYGPLTQGLAKPINDLSRGCNEFDIVGVVAITCVQVKK